MTTRLAHLSDLHLPAREPEQLAALVRAVRAAAPDIVVISGDITRAGARVEFRLGEGFVAALPGRKIIVPGNHDIPAFHIPKRIFSPFSRFEDAFGQAEGPIFENDDLLLVGLNTAYGIRLSADWSLGHAGHRKIERTADIIRTRRNGRLALVACHHPLLANALDPRRSRTAGGQEGFTVLADAGMDIVLHGHLHRAASECLRFGSRQVFQIGANTALSDRERDGASGFNLLDIADGRWQVSPMVWRNREYVSVPLGESSAVPIGIPESAS